MGEHLNWGFDSYKRWKGEERGEGEEEEGERRRKRGREGVRWGEGEGGGAKSSLCGDNDIHHPLRSPMGLRRTPGTRDIEGEIRVIQ